MKIGSFGYINHNGVFQFPNYIMEAVSFEDGGILFGVYHPFTDEDFDLSLDDSKASNLDVSNFAHDFYFSPIPLIFGHTVEDLSVGYKSNLRQ